MYIDIFPFCPKEYPDTMKHILFFHIQLHFRLLCSSCMGYITDWLWFLMAVLTNLKIISFEKT